MPVKWKWSGVFQLTPFDKTLQKPRGRVERGGEGLRSFRKIEKHCYPPKTFRRFALKTIGELAGISMTMDFEKSEKIFGGHIFENLKTIFLNNILSSEVSDNTQVCSIKHLRSLWQFFTFEKTKCSLMSPPLYET